MNIDMCMLYIYILLIYYYHYRYMSQKISFMANGVANLNWVLSLLALIVQKYKY